ncbi:MAG: type II toxin-antitoxin system VapC family toxin [Sphingomonadaceae bacterium]|nr:type II toxin-antitoxin system VapC family toxin [Sphingomonadaceae bacterium]
MKSVDSNILLRAIVNDDVDQAARAREVLRENCFVSNSVFLETAWVLKSFYGFERQLVVEALQAILAAETVHVATLEGLSWALSSFSSGGDIADMLHLVEAIGSDSFVTFDRQIGRIVDPPLPVNVLR